MGAPEALRLWADAATTTGRHGMELSVADHLTLLERLVTTTEDAAARAVARGLVTRLKCFRLLDGRR